MFNKTLGELLVENGVVDKVVIDNAILLQAKSGKKLGRILQEQGHLDEVVLYDFLQKQLGIKFLTSISELPDKEILHILPLRYCRTKGIAPVHIDAKTVKVYMSEPTNTAMINEISFMSGRVVEVEYATESAIQEFLANFTGNQPAAKPDPKDKKAVIKEEKKINENDSPVVRFVEETINSAINRQVSDIHFEQYEKSCFLRFRIDGVLHKIEEMDFAMYPAIISRLKILSELDISEKRLPQDGRIMIMFEDRKVDIRVSIIPTVHGENAVLRILDKGKTALTLDDVGLDNKRQNEIKKEARKPYGMILVTGPTGSGKTTTLYAVLQYLLQFEKKILTVEDPVEYQIDGISQTQVHSEIGLSFAHGLRSFLRHDPDIIMVGEIRDRETADIAVRAALTGHLVLSTVHTNDAASSLTRFVDMGIPPYLLTSTVNIILAQRLVRKICPKCKEEIKLSKEDIISMDIKDSFKAGDTVHHGKGCKSCGKTGYQGRTPIFEILKISDNVKKALLKGESSFEIKDLAQKEGMFTLRDSGIDLVKRGVTTLEEIEKIVALGD